MTSASRYRVFFQLGSNSWPKYDRITGVSYGKSISCTYVGKPEERAGVFSFAIAQLIKEQMKVHDIEVIIEPYFPTFLIGATYDLRHKIPVANRSISNTRTGRT